MTYDLIGEKHFDDIGYSASAFRSKEYPETHIQFNVYEIVATGIHDFKTGRSFPRGFQRKDSDFSPDIVETKEEAEVYLEGSVKWDGCSNWKFVHQERVMLHYCQKESAVAIGTLFGYLYDWAKELGMDRL